MIPVSLICLVTGGLLLCVAAIYVLRKKLFPCCQVADDRGERESLLKSNNSHSGRYTNPSSSNSIQESSAVSCGGSVAGQMAECPKLDQCNSPKSPIQRKSSHRATSPLNSDPDLHKTVSSKPSERSKESKESNESKEVKESNADLPELATSNSSQSATSFMSHSSFQLDSPLNTPAQTKQKTVSFSEKIESTHSIPSSLENIPSLGQRTVDHIKHIAVQVIRTQPASFQNLAKHEKVLTQYLTENEMDGPYLQNKDKAQFVENGRKYFDDNIKSSFLYEFSDDTLEEALGALYERLTSDDLSDNHRGSNVGSHIPALDLDHTTKLDESLGSMQSMHSLPSVPLLPQPRLSAKCCDLGLIEHIKNILDELPQTVSKKEALQKVQEKIDERDSITHMKHHFEHIWADHRRRMGVDMGKPQRLQKSQTKIDLDVGDIVNFEKSVPPDLEKRIGDKLKEKIKGDPTVWEQEWTNEKRKSVDKCPCYQRICGVLAIYAEFQDDIDAFRQSEEHMNQTINDDDLKLGSAEVGYGSTVFVSDDFGSKESNMVPKISNMMSEDVNIKTDVGQQIDWMFQCGAYDRLCLLEDFLYVRNAHIDQMNDITSKLRKNYKCTSCPNAIRVRTTNRSRGIEPVSRGLVEQIHAYFLQFRCTLCFSPLFCLCPCNAVHV